MRHVPPVDRHGRAPERRRAGTVVGALLAMAVLGSATTSTYTVRSGDSLWLIARRVGSTVAALASANQLADPDRLQPGQTLTVPAAGAAPSGGGAPAAAPSYHVIAPGETLGGIAARYGVPVAALQEANGLTRAGLILSGARLRLSGPAPAAPVAAPAGGTHVVVAGDTLGAIAARYGTTSAALAAASGIANPNRLRIGDHITVPAPTWRCPVPGARFVNDYGVPKPDGRFHEGVDLYAPHGTPVVAPVAGDVRQEHGPRGGLQFSLTGHDGTRYIGTHMGSAGVDGRVAAGDPLGTVGDTGNARGGPPHLHFEQHPGGEGSDAVNPFPLLARHCGG